MPSSLGRQDFFRVKVNSGENGTGLALINSTIGWDGNLIPVAKLHRFLLSSFLRGHHKNSLFADFDDREVPGIQEILGVIDERSERIGNLNSDLSPWNLAIAILPLVMTAIPISAMERVSKFRAILYALLTDVLAVYPLLMKGRKSFNI